MNYLAHIHLAHASQTSLLGNFLGDFVKGKQIELLDAELHKGVWLHRKIDAYTDSHPCVVGLKRQFPPTLRRMSGVILDIYFDYLLCQHWSTFSDVSLEKLLALFYQQLGTHDLILNSRFQRIRSSLLTDHWLINYTRRAGFVSACYQIEKRLRNRIIFAQQADQYMVELHSTVEEQFMTFYPQLIHYSKSIS
ncbi:ACP phosphodiesterase [Aliiglaciecola litoralis]|uniref:ACP phosphodiesterase n=1 Tax=Aliiglaciecola litoralis TaxID=582857 RepID=A0ABN1LET9_9ALTE